MTVLLTVASSIKSPRLPSRLKDCSKPVFCRARTVFAVSSGEPYFYLATSSLKNDFAGDRSHFYELANMGRKAHLT